MDQWDDDSEEDDSANDEEQEQEPDLPTGGQDQAEDEVKPAEQVPQADSGDEWNTDLEIDNRCGFSMSREELYLQACQHTGATPVSSFIRQLGETNLNLNHYGVGPTGTKAVAIVLQTDNAVTKLEMVDNAIGAEGTRYLMEMLQANITIHDLNLSNNQLKFEGANIISKMLHDNYYIKSLVLSGNEFDDAAAKCFADALKGDYVVKELDLSHNKICDAGGEHLGYMLVSNVGIEVLNLSWNHLRMRGAVCLNSGLKVNSTLKQLNLSWNGFGQFEAESLGNALKQNSTLMLLDLSSNRIDDEAVTLLCNGLNNNEALKVLKLSDNPMTSAGALTLMKMVRTSAKSGLEEINISTVFVCEAFMELLDAAVKRRPSLNVQHSIMNSVTRNLSALPILLKFLQERNESLMDFFRALDKEGTSKLATAAFREAVKENNIPLDQRQLDWLMRKFDPNCTAIIAYNQFADLS